MLSRRRSSGMAANPITDVDLEAFCRRRLIELSAWEKELIFRLDDAALAAWRGEAKERQRRASQTPEEAAQIPVTNTAGIRAVLFSASAKWEAAEALKARRKAPDP